MAIGATSFADYFYKNRLPLFAFDLLTEFYTTHSAEDTFNATADLSAKRSALTTAQNTVVDSFETTNDGLIATAITNIDALVDATSLSPEDKTALKSAIATEINTTITPNYATHKSNLESAVTAQITDAGTPIQITEVIAQQKTHFVSARDLFEYEGETYFNFTDPKCKGTGWHEASQEPGADPSVTTKIRCTSCDGFGKTYEQNQVITANYSVSDSGVPTT